MKKIVISLALVTVLVLSAFNDKSAIAIEDVFNRVSKIERFETMPFNGDEFGFPENLGTGTLAIHPNASPREAITGLLDKLPKETLVYDDTGENGEFDRFFLENGTTLLYVHVSHGTGDTVLIIFRDCNKEKVKAFIEEIKEKQKRINED